MSSGEACSFCNPNELEDRIINESDLFISFLSHPRLAAGHSLVIPRRHIEMPMALHTDEITEIFSEIQRLQYQMMVGKLAIGCDVWQKYLPVVPEDGVKMNHVHFH